LAWKPESSVRPFVCPSLWLVVECAARIDFCRSFVANRRYSGGRQLISAWGGVGGGEDPGQGKQTTTVSADSQIVFLSFFDIESIECLSECLLLTLDHFFMKCATPVIVTLRI
jgi:hypothetical protein